MTKEIVTATQGYLLQMGAVARALVSRPFHRRELLEQLDAIGVASLTVVLLTGMFTGMVLVLQTGSTLD